MPMRCCTQLPLGYVSLSRAYAAGAQSAATLRDEMQT